MARRLSDRVALAHALDIRFWVIYSPDNIEERLAMANELVSLTEITGDEERRHQAHHWRMLVFWELGDMEAANQDIEAQVRIAEDLRQPSQLMYTRTVLATRAILQGRFDEGERLAREALVSGQQSDNQTAFGYFAVQMATLRVLRGELNEADAVAAKSAIDQVRYQPVWRCGLANIYAELDREAEACREFEHLAAGAFKELPRDPQWLIGMALLCQVCTYLGDVPRAEILYQLLSLYPLLNILAPPMVCMGSVSRYLGLLATTVRRYNEASRHFEDALEMNERMGARPWVAHTQYDYAKMLLARGRKGDRDKALDLLDQALAAAQEMGMKALQEKVQRLLPKSREDVVRPGAPR